MKKKLSIMIMFVIILNFSCVSAMQSKEVKNLLPEDINSITIKDTNQQHVRWDIFDDEINRLIEIIGNITIVEIVENRKDEADYKFYINSEKEIKEVMLYKEGYINIDQITYKMYFEDIYIYRLNELLSTQTKGYGNVMPNKGELIEISIWAENYYEQAKKNDIVPQYMYVGYMTDKITREQFCDVISMMIKKSTGEYIEEFYKKTFFDTQNKNVYFLEEKNIIKGKGNACFEPNDFLTREEAATIIYRCLKYLDEVNYEEKNYKYKDDGEISEWAKEAIYSLKEQGIMIGKERNMFYPTDMISKEEAITLCLRVHEKL